MNDGKLLIFAMVILLLEAGAIAAGGEPGEGDATSASVATLKRNLGSAEGLEIDEVRVTGSGVACIDYRVSNGKDGKSLGHAVVQGDQVLKSSVDNARFEKAWNEHCLGPRGGMTSQE